eukprot:SAG31_NODE_34448_length_332_cov_6.416309_1_plen_24_part_10
MEARSSVPTWWHGDGGSLMAGALL